jgi:hypothetical protein
LGFVPRRYKSSRADKSVWIMVPVKIRPD